MNRRYLTCFFFLTWIFYWSAANAQTPINDSVISSIHRFSLNTGVKSVVPYGNRFLCLDEGVKLFFVDPKSNQIDSSINKYSSDFNFRELQVINDTIIGIERYQSYFLDLLKKQWKVYKIKKYVYPGNLIFQDKDYFISKTCSGEWGGTIYFTDRKTFKTYEGECTCAVDVIKKDGYYNIAASLAHMSGFTTIFNIKNPRALKLHAIKKTNNSSKPLKIAARGSVESNSIRGMEKLADTIGGICVGSFKYKSTILYVVEYDSFKNPPSVWIDTIQKNKFVHLVNLTHFGILETGYDIFSNNGTIISPFDNKDFSGFIYIADNKMNLYIFDRLKK